MKAHVFLLAIGLLALAGCGEEPAVNPDRPTTEKPKVTPPPQFDKARPDESAIVLPQFFAYEQPIYAQRNLPVFDGLVRMENGIAAVEPYLHPEHERLRIDWQYITENTANIELGVVQAIDEHVDTALNRKPKGGGVPAFGEAFQQDLTNLHFITRHLHAAALARDLKMSMRCFEMLRVSLGKRPAMLRGGGNAAAPAPAPAPEMKPAPVRNTGGDDLIKGKDETYGDLGAIKLRTDLRTTYEFWPAPAGAKTVYLSANPPPKKLDYTYDMSHSVDFDTPRYPQPAIVNTKDLREENTYSRRISPTETR